MITSRRRCFVVTGATKGIGRATSDLLRSRNVTAAVDGKSVTVSLTDANQRVEPKGEILIADIAQNGNLILIAVNQGLPDASVIELVADGQVVDVVRRPVGFVFLASNIGFDEVTVRNSQSDAIGRCASNTIGGVSCNIADNRPPVTTNPTN
jgi:hypothetical protein